MGFVLISNESLDGATAVIDEAAIGVYGERGWKLVDEAAHPALTPAEVEGAPDTNTYSEPEQPAGNASADEWRAYAIGHGVSAEEAMQMGRDEIRALFVAKEN